MHKTLSAVFAFGLLALTACARAEHPPRNADPAVWVVRDADTTIYLFGTVHILKPDVVWFDDEVKAAFDRSDELVTEMVAPSPAEMAGLVAQLAYNPDGPTVSEQLAPADRDRFLAALKREGVAQEPLDHFDPWLAGIQLSVAPLDRLGYKADSGAETVLERAAKAQGKRISGLETPAQQLGYFDAMPKRLQIAFLNDTVSELPGLEKSFRTLLVSWSRGKTEAIGWEMNGSLEKTPELAGILLYQRNERWAQWIAQRMAQPGTVFVAVGAGHLAGKVSVQEDLAKRGFSARRISKRDFGLK